MIAKLRLLLHGTPARMDSTDQNLDPILWLLAIVNFLVGMGAFLIVGLLSPIQQSLNITLMQAGLLLTVYSLTYAVCSPLGVALTGNRDRKTVLIGCLIVFTLSTLAAALASSYTLLLCARIATAVAAGIVTPVTASIAISTSTGNTTGQSLSRVFLGFTLAQVVGIPAASFLGHTFGWETAFYTVFSLSSLVTLVLFFALQRGITAEVTNVSMLKTTLMDWRDMFSVTCTSTFICGIYILYTFLEPLVVETLNFGRDELAALLLVFGLGALAGNHMGGILTDKIGAVSTLVLLCTIQIILMPLFSFLPDYTPLLWILVFAWSLFSWSFMIAQQKRLVQQSPQRQSILLALNASAIYIGAAAGSMLGGLVVTYISIESLGIAGGLVALLALLHLMFSEHFVLSTTESIA